MEISFWWLTAIAGAALAAGFCMGRLMGGQWENPEQENRRENRRESKRENRRDSGIRFPFSVGSPVSGEVADRSGEGKTMAAIHPNEDRLYAPANGKITKIFPGGNGFLFRTEFGAELCIRVGDSEDDLLERYYRPRIVQNEIVGKGKLLLEFDRKGLVKEGASCCVTVTVETGACAGSLLAAAGEQVKAGEPILGLRPAMGEECREALYG
ncbi:MAG: PTS glucose transporter subunit IIA [Butyrivibrio sp.]|nr:PTS glucose transporter subunit IIA [Acetatifactor muris]MCM1559120.1 PTS glucose transporter subunit IIA [Butyrivibrio sp.]